MAFDEASAIVALRDPNTSAQTLYELAGAFPHLRPAISQHPNVYPELGAWIRAQAQDSGVNTTSVHTAPANTTPANTTPMSTTPMSAPSYPQGHTRSSRSPKMKRTWVPWLTSAIIIVVAVAVALTTVLVVAHQNRVSGTLADGTPWGPELGAVVETSDASLDLLGTHSGALELDTALALSPDNAWVYAVSSEGIVGFDATDLSRATLSTTDFADFTDFSGFLSPLAQVIVSADGGTLSVLAHDSEPERSAVFTFTLDGPRATSVSTYIVDHTIRSVALSVDGDVLYLASEDALVAHELLSGRTLARTTSVDPYRVAVHPVTGELYASITDVEGIGRIGLATIDPVSLNRTNVLAHTLEDRDFFMSSDGATIIFPMTSTTTSSLIDTGSRDSHELPFRVFHAHGVLPGTDQIIFDRGAIDRITDAHTAIRFPWADRVGADGHHLYKLDNIGEVLQRYDISASRTNWALFWGVIAGAGALTVIALVIAPIATSRRKNSNRGLSVSAARASAQ